MRETLPYMPEWSGVETEENLQGKEEEKRKKKVPKNQDKYLWNGWQNLCSFRAGLDASKFHKEKNVPRPRIRGRGLRRAVGPKSPDKLDVVTQTFNSGKFPRSNVLPLKELLVENESDDKHSLDFIFELFLAGKKH